MNWTLTEEQEPAMAKRVVVETQEGSMLFAKRVNRAGGGTHYIDDQTLPIRSPVVRWSEVS